MLINGAGTVATDTLITILVNNTPPSTPQVNWIHDGHHKTRLVHVHNLNQRVNCFVLALACHRLQTYTVWYGIYDGCHKTRLVHMHNLLPQDLFGTHAQSASTRPVWYTCTVCCHKIRLVHMYSLLPQDPFGTHVQSAATRSVWYTCTVCCHKTRLVHMYSLLPQDQFGTHVQSAATRPVWYTCTICCHKTRFVHMHNLNQISYFLWPNKSTGCARWSRIISEFQDSTL